jgi:hypothetical protein
MIRKIENESKGRCPGGDDAAAIVGWLNSDGDDFCVALPAHGVSRE